MKQGQSLEELQKENEELQNRVNELLQENEDAKKQLENQKQLCDYYSKDAEKYKNILVGIASISNASISR